MFQCCPSLKSRHSLQPTHTKSHRSCCTRTGSSCTIHLHSFRRNCWTTCSNSPTVEWVGEASGVEVSGASEWAWEASEAGVWAVWVQAWEDLSNLRHRCQLGSQGGSRLCHKPLRSHRGPKPRSWNP